MRMGLIHNPRGGSATESDLDRILSALGSTSVDVRLVEEGGDATELARAAIASGASLLIASGGDGTVSAVAAAAIERPQVALAVVPRGTANSIAAFFDIPTDLEAACEVARAGAERLIDTAEVDGRTMVLMVTVGLHADAVTGADPARKRQLGALAYVLEGLEHLAEEDPFELILASEGASFSCEASSLTIANLAPPSSLLAQGPGKLVDDDGLLDVTIVTVRSTGEALATALHLAAHAWAETPSQRRNILHFRAKDLRVETREPRPVMVDGDPAGVTPFTARVRPRSLRLKVPGRESERG